MRSCTTHASTNPSYDNRTIASTLKMQIWFAMNNRNVPWVMKTKFPARVMVFGVVSSEGHIMPPHIFEVGLKVNTKCTWMCWRVWWFPGAIRWLVADPGCGGPQVQKGPGLASEGVLRLCTLLSLPPPWPEPAGLLRLVIHQEHHQHDLPQHQSQPDHRRLWKKHTPSSGSDWGWRQLHWIDVSSTT